MSLEDYYRKKKENFEKDAKIIVEMYNDLHNSSPDESVLKEYFWLFEERKSVKKEYDNLMLRTGYYEKCKNTYCNSISLFKDFNDFVQKSIAEDK